MTAGDWQRRLHDWQGSGLLEKILPEVMALDGIMQPAEFHAEGDALIHTMLAVDAVEPTADERIFWAVLLHDIGKAFTTEYFDGNWRSHGHCAAGAKKVSAVLDRLDLSFLADDVTWLVRHHHFALDWGHYVFDGLTKKQMQFCQHRLFPLLVDVCRADASASLGVSSKRNRLDAVLTQLVEYRGGFCD